MKSRTIIIFDALRIMGSFFPAFPVISHDLNAAVINLPWSLATVSGRSRIVPEVPECCLI